MPSSAFFTIPEDYIREAPFTHPLLARLPATIGHITRLTTPYTPRAPGDSRFDEHFDISLPSGQQPDRSDLLGYIRDGVKIWRKDMFRALMSFYEDTIAKPVTLSNLVHSPKVKMIRVLHAIRTYATLLQQFREARKVFLGAQGHAEVTGKGGIWQEIWTDLQTVEFRMKRFFENGEIPVDMDIRLDQDCTELE